DNNLIVYNQFIIPIKVLLVELKEYLREYEKYNKKSIKKLILYSVIGFYFLFLFFYNFYRQYGISVELSWLNGIISALITTLTYLLLFDLIGFLLKLELIKGKLKSILTIGVICACILLFVGIIGVNNLIIGIIITVVPSVFLALFMPLVLGIIGLIGIILIFTGKKHGKSTVHIVGYNIAKIYGKYLIFIVGFKDIIALIGMFITIFADVINILPLVLILIYVDPLLLLIGNAQGFILKE
ncbi:MAG: hypothetical protein ACFFBZ_06315, partial [Promethearchaeota archaeon]